MYSGLAAVFNRPPYSIPAPPPGKTRAVPMRSKPCNKAREPSLSTESAMALSVCANGMIVFAGAAATSSCGLVYRGSVARESDVGDLVKNGDPSRYRGVGPHFAARRGAIRR
jgi:hypothetical protein